MSETKWKFQLRDDQIDTLAEALDFVLECNNQQLGVRTGSDALAHRVCRARVKEIRDYIWSTAR